MAIDPTDNRGSLILSGRHEGFPIRIELARGMHRVGSSPPSDVRLRFPGVSRRHAVLTVTETGVVIEDAGSRNGTFVGGRQVRRAAVTVGTEIGFGPVRLNLEPGAEDEGALTLRIQAPPPDPTQGDDASTMGLHPSFVIMEAWIAVLEDLTEELHTVGKPDGRLVVESLCQSLRATAVGIVNWPATGEAVVQAASGRLPELPPRAAIVAAVKASAEPSDEAGPLTIVVPLAGVAASLYALLGDGEPVLGLVVALEIPVHGSAAKIQERLFGLLLHMLMIGRGEAPSKQASSARRETDGHASLRFPDDYYRGRSAAMQSLYRDLAAAASQPIPTLLTGETGVGKDRLASILHASSSVGEAPFVAINCAAIPAEMLEAELFGIGAKVATGVRAREGRFMQANGGTFFLDEIGEMPTALQAKLLRVLETGRVQPVGGRERKVDVRLIAATNADLETQMDEGTFRRDLFYRLSGFVLRVPPLRACRDDIAGLFAFFLERHCRATKVSIEGVRAKALQALERYGWPGNVRELEHEARRLVITVGQTRGLRVIDSALLSPVIREARVERAGAVDADDLALAPRLEAYERTLILEALERTGGRRIEAAMLLGLHRNGLRSKMKRLGIEV